MRPQHVLLQASISKDPLSLKRWCRGAHDKRFICKPDKKMLKCILKAGGSLVRILTIAPELTGIEDIIAMAKDENIIVSMGHTLADASQIERAIEKELHV